MHELRSWKVLVPKDDLHISLVTLVVDLFHLQLDRHVSDCTMLLRLKYILKLKFDMLCIYISKKCSVILFSLVQSLIQAIADENWFSQFSKHETTSNGLQRSRSTSRLSPAGGVGCLRLYTTALGLIKASSRRLKCLDCNLNVPSNHIHQPFICRSVINLCRSVTY